MDTNYLKKRFKNKKNINWWFPRWARNISENSVFNPDKKKNRANDDSIMWRIVYYIYS